MRSDIPAQLHEVYDEDVRASVLVYVKWKDRNTIRHASSETFVLHEDVSRCDGGFPSLLQDRARIAMRDLVNRFEITNDEQ